MREREREKGRKEIKLDMKMPRRLDATKTKKKREGARENGYKSLKLLQLDRRDGHSTHKLLRLRHSFHCKTLSYKRNLVLRVGQISLIFLDC